MVASTFMEHPDFVEGVEALLKKPTRTPKWQPEKLEDVTPDQVDKFFSTKSRARLPLYTEGNYLQYHEGTGRKSYGLPAESAIQRLVSGETEMTQSQVIKHILKTSNHKLGAEQKVKEIISRKCGTNDRGYLVWKD
jgi:3-hydroxyisobutyryl-CoA hydrolase